MTNFEKFQEKGGDSQACNRKIQKDKQTSIFQIMSNDNSNW